MYVYHSVKKIDMMSFNFREEKKDTSTAISSNHTKDVSSQWIRWKYEFERKKEKKNLTEIDKNQNNKTTH